MSANPAASRQLDFFIGKVSTSRRRLPAPLGLATNQGAVRIFDDSSAPKLRTLQEESEDDSMILTIEVSPNGGRIIAGDFDGVVTMWNRATGRMTWSARDHEKAVTCLAFSPDGRRVVSHSDDQTLKVWYAETGEGLLTLHHGEPYGVNCVAFSPDGTTILVGGEHSMREWFADH